MRRAVIILAASAAFVGCSVELEGAACDVPGATDQCPDGQACGIDRRCSSNPRLECDPPGAELAVDQERSGQLAGGLTITPTGAAEPPGCRLGTLGAALAAVQAGTTGIRIFNGTQEQATYTFTAPLVIGDGFTLAGESAGGEVVLQASAAMASLVKLSPGGTLENVTLESAVDQAGDAIVLECGPATKKATLASVTVDAASKVRHGVVVSGSCGLEAARLVVNGADQDGVRIETDATTLNLLNGGELSGNGRYGLAVESGKVLAQGTSAVHLAVHHNVTNGVHVTAADSTTVPTDVTLRLADVHDNGAAGVAIVDARRGSNTSTIEFDQIAVYKNAASAYGNRWVGGILLQGALAPAFAMKASTVCGNAKDEVAVYSDASWNLAGGDACGPTSNRFFVPGVAGQDYFIYSTASAANVDGRNNFYGANPPSSYLRSVNFTECSPAPAVPAYCN